MDSIQGLALVASPYLSDPNFLRSVVYILRHDAEGALGLVLNRPTDINVGDLLEQLSEQSICNQRAVFCGGPVDGPLVMLQTVDLAGAQVISVASDQERILEVCSRDCDEQQYRVFDGYSGWAPGQLEHELKSGGWITWNIDVENVFADPDQLWHLAIKSIGRDILSGGIDPSRIPEDPAYN